MPVRRQDTQRALRLLEDYRAKLSPREDRQLRSSVERVIGIFRSSLFQALLDIQEFYEVTLLENPKSIDHSKQAESVEPVSTWDFPSLPSTSVTSETLPSSQTVDTQKCCSQDDDLFSLEPSSFPQAPELVHVSEKNLSQLEKCRPTALFRITRSLLGRGDSIIHLQGHAEEFSGHLQDKIARIRSKLDSKREAEAEEMPRESCYQVIWEQFDAVGP